MWGIGIAALIGAAGAGYYVHQSNEAKRIAQEQAAAEDARRAEERRAAEAAEKERLEKEAKLAREREELARREAAALKAQLAREQADAARKAAEADAATKAAQAEAARRAAQAQAKSAQGSQAVPQTAPQEPKNPCGGTQGLQREKCTSCWNREPGPVKFLCEQRAKSRYCSKNSGLPECR